MNPYLAKQIENHRLRIKHKKNNLEKLNKFYRSSKKLENNLYKSTYPYVNAKIQADELITKTIEKNLAISWELEEEEQKKNDEIIKIILNQPPGTTKHMHSNTGQIFHSYNQSHTHLPTPNYNLSSSKHFLSPSASLPSLRYKQQSG